MQLPQEIVDAITVENLKEIVTYTLAENDIIASNSELAESHAYADLGYNLRLVAATLVVLEYFGEK